MLDRDSAQDKSNGHDSRVGHPPLGNAATEPSGHRARGRVAPASRTGRRGRAAARHLHRQLERRRQAGVGDPVRRHGAGDGDGARSARSAVARRSRPRPAVRVSCLAPESDVHLGRGADARARHRRKHGDFLPGGRRAPPRRFPSASRATSSCFVNAAQAGTSSLSPPPRPRISPRTATRFRDSRRSVRSGHAVSVNGEAELATDAAGVGQLPRGARRPRGSRHGR